MYLRCSLVGLVPWINLIQCQDKVRLPVLAPLLQSVMQDQDIHTFRATFRLENVGSGHPCGL
jgi:hypothetical protein